MIINLDKRTLLLGRKEVKILNILKIGFLFLGIMFTCVNFSRLFYKQHLPMANFLYQTLGIVGFLVIQFKLY